MKVAAIIATLLGGGLLGALAVLFLHEIQARQALESNLAELKTTLEEARDRIDTLESRNQEILADLKEQRAKNENLQASMTNRPSSGSEEPSVRFASSERQTYRVRAYMGEDYLGSAVLVPQPTSKTNSNGETIFEPVVVLDNGMRNHFTQYKTNVVERVPQAQPPTQVNYPYSYYSPYYYSAAAASSVFINKGQNGTDNGGSNTPSTPSNPPSSHPQSPRSDSPWVGYPGQDGVSRRQQEVPPISTAGDPVMRQQNLKTRAAEIETRKVPRFGADAN